MCTVWRQVHVLGHFKADEKPNRAELESILKAGGASLVDAAEPRVDLAIMHSSTPHDNPRVIARASPILTLSDHQQSSTSQLHHITQAGDRNEQCVVWIWKTMSQYATRICTGMCGQGHCSHHCQDSHVSPSHGPTEAIHIYGEPHMVLMIKNLQVTALIRAKVCCASPNYIVEWLAKPKQALGQHLLFKSKPGSKLSKMAKERHLSLDPAESASL